MRSVKDLVESNTLTTIPANFSYFSNDNGSVDEVVQEDIPAIDFSLLTSASPDERSKAIQELAKACQDWGAFTVINHGVPESLIERMLGACQDFFDQTEEEKSVNMGTNLVDPILYGTSINTSVVKVGFWRDYLKVLVHPKFHSPTTPPSFSEISFEYCKNIRQLVRELLRGISESLGLEKNYVDKAMELDSCFQLLAANLYPPCPQPELAIGIPPHSDHGLLTALVHNQVGGLQFQHNGKWNAVNASPYSIFVNTGDHLEILSNGKYKSVVHRAVLNDKATRISIAIPTGPSPEVKVIPAPELTDANNPPAYIGMKYKDYLQLLPSSSLDQLSCLNHVRV
ncbi:hypothetical protein ACHQM5_011286 [Ranunculus cassubicifolius]